MFKVGDIVQRLKGHQVDNWDYGDKPLTINTVYDNGFLYFKEVVGIWDSSKFKLVSQTEQSYPFIKEIPAQKAHREIQRGKLLDHSWFSVEPSDLADGRIILRDNSSGFAKNHYLSEKELRDTAAAFIAIADVLKENSHG